jgi:hypothetical protein
LQRPKIDGQNSLFFLDSYIFQVSRSSIASPVVELPQDLLQLVDDEREVRQDADFYFEHLQPLFPIGGLCMSVTVGDLEDSPFLLVATTQYPSCASDK